MREDDTMDVDRPRRCLLAAMTSLCPTRPLASGVAHRDCLCSLLSAALPLLLALALAPSAAAQISLGSAVDLALRGSPRVQGAQADVAKARAQLTETHDVYVPAISAGAGLGQAYGYLPDPPTEFTISAGSLVFSVSQRDYIRSAQAGLNATLLALQNIREQVAEDTALAFLALNHDQQRQRNVALQEGYATTLVGIVQQRLDAGQDAPVDLTQARLTAAQLHLANLRAQDETEDDRDRLARLVGLPAAALSGEFKLPAAPALPDPAADIAVSSFAHGYANSAVASAFANAEAKRQQAAGDTRFQFWPRIDFNAEYNRYATFTNSFAILESLNNQSGQIGANEGAFGVLITLPILDRSHAARARESAADAARALHDAQTAQMDALDGQSHLRHTIDELQAQAEVAGLQQQLAQQQLDILHQKLQSGTGNPDGPQLTPKDEQTARIAERDKYLLVLDAAFQLRQAEIQLLRQTGQLIPWLRSSAAAAQPATTQLPAAPAPVSPGQQSLPANPTAQP